MKSERKAQHTVRCSRRRGRCHRRRCSSSFDHSGSGGRSSVATVVMLRISPSSGIAIRGWCNVACGVVWLIPACVPTSALVFGFVPVRDAG